MPHELNPRLHSDAQRQVLAELYRDIGFARSLLAYELADGKLKLLDGHLRQALEPELVVDVEILDVNDAEARTLLLSLDPLAQLADYDKTMLEQPAAAHADRLRCGSHQPVGVHRSGERCRRSSSAQEAMRRRLSDGEVREQFLILVECAQRGRAAVRLLERFQAEGLKCKPLLS